MVLPASSGTWTSSYISGSGVASGYNEGYKTTFCFENYCPLCGHHACLSWNPKGTVEGEITCRYCDADYSVSGRDKYYKGARAWLIEYTPPAPKVETPPAPEPPKSQLDLFKDVLNTHKDLITL
jgi:hypothetical protein